MSTNKPGLRELIQQMPHDAAAHKWNAGQLCWRCKMESALADPPAEPLTAEQAEAATAPIDKLITSSSDPDFRALLFQLRTDIRDLLTEAQKASVPVTVEEDDYPFHRQPCTRNMTYCSECERIMRIRRIPLGAAQQEASTPTASVNPIPTSGGQFPSSLSNISGRVEPAAPTQMPIIEPPEGAETKRKS